MNRIKFLDGIIKLTKERAKPGDSPELYVNAPKGLVMALLALEKKYAAKMAIEVMRVKYNDPEMVLVNEAWFVKAKNLKNIKVQPSQDPDRKECFIISYFSKTKCLSHSLVFKRKNKGLIWTEEYNYWDSKNNESVFNPYKFKKEDIQHWLQLSKIDEIKEKGEKEIFKMAFGHKLISYRYENEAVLECFNGKGECYQASKAMPTALFNQKISMFKELLSRVRT